MLSGIIGYQVLQQENPKTIEKVNTVLEKHPWYANQWQARLQDVPVADHGLVLFMQAARWADERQSRSRGFSILWGTSTNPYTRRSYSRLTRAKRKGHRNSQGWYYFSQQGWSRVTTTMSAGISGEPSGRPSGAALFI
jgi:hypothetical protein